MVDRAGAVAPGGREAIPPRKVHVLVLGQTPPPFHGQALMIEQLLGVANDRIEVTHVRLRYSASIGEVGRFALRKLLHLVQVILTSWWYLLTRRIDILYYPPAGHGKNPVLRDLITLGCLRPFARKLCLHFHAEGLTSFIDELPARLRPVVRLPYSGPDAVIVMSPSLSSPSEVFRPRSTFVIPYGQLDAACGRDLSMRQQNKRPVILFVGNLLEDKGIFVLAEALSQLRARGVSFEARLVGASHSVPVMERFEAFLHAKGLTEHVHRTGPLTGEEKWREFVRANIFCFPTHYANEAFPVVLLEAQMFGLPIVSTNWRGVPGIVREGREGYLVPVQDPSACAESLATLIADPETRLRLGEAGRRRYEAEFRAECYIESLRRAFLEIAAP